MENGGWEESRSMSPRSAHDTRGAVSNPRADHFERRYPPTGRQCFDGAIKGGKHPVVMICQREEVRVGDLLMALQLARDGIERFRNGKILDPELMVLVRDVR